MTSLASKVGHSDDMAPVIKVNWTQHGGGTDGYYYRSKDKKVHPIHEDFLDVRVLLENINEALSVNNRTINCLKIFRWTSPGAVLVTNEPIDDEFRNFFSHPLWYDIYKKKQTRQDREVPAGEAVVGADEGYKRGPAELLKDLHLAKYCVGDEGYDGYEPNIFTNELISSEYKSKYTQMVAEDFGLWLLRDDGTRDSPDNFEKKFPQEWVKSPKKAKKALQKMHNDIFKIGRGEAGDPMNSKMSVVIKNIILKCSNVVEDDDEWNRNCKNWEFYPISCSPMNGVEGKKELLRIESGGASDALKKAHEKLGKSYNALYAYDAEQAEEERQDNPSAVLEQRNALLDAVEEEFTQVEEKIHELDANKEVVRKRLNANSGLWFVYMLNMIRRIWVFLTGKEERKKYVDMMSKPPGERDVKSVIDRKTTFYNSFDVLDPDERKQLYSDINGILQNIRPNAEKQDAQKQGNRITFFTNAQILLPDNKVEEFNLFNDEKLVEYMGRLIHGVKLDGRANFISKIEADWLGENGVLDRILFFVHKKFMNLIKDNDPHGFNEEEKYEQIPILVKLVFFLLYTSSHTEDGIAKSYMTDPGNKKTAAAVTNALLSQQQQQKKTDESMGWKLGFFMPFSWIKSYDFSTAIHGFLKTGRTWSTVVSNEHGGKMAVNLRTQLRSTIGVKEREVSMADIYNFLDTAFDYKEKLYERMKILVTDPYFQDSVKKIHDGNADKLLSDTFYEEMIKVLEKEDYTTQKEFEETFKKFKKYAILVPTEIDKHGYYQWPKATNPLNYIIIMNGKYKHHSHTGKSGVMSITSAKRGGKKKRKKRTRRKRKKKRKRTRKRKKRNCKKRMKKKIICLSAPNKKATRKLIRVTKKLARMKGIRLSKCSKQRIKKWGKKKKRTRRKR